MKSLAESTALPVESITLRSTIEDVLSEHRENGHVITGPDVSIRPTTATLLEIALEDLAVHAAQNGALSFAEAQLSVTWRVEEGETPRVTLDWVESGLPHVEQLSIRFNARRIRAVFDKEPEASVQLGFVPGGVMCRFVFQAC